MDLLRRANELASDNARYAYVYAVALNSTGAHGDAMALLTHRQHPADRDVLMALISIARNKRNFAAALQHAQEMVTLDPTDTQFRSLVSDLEKRQPH